MQSNAKKTLILIAKLLVGLGLMTWVLLGAHWSDFVRSKDGKASYSVIDASQAPDKFVVSKGMLWWSQTLVMSSDQLQAVELPNAQGDPARQYLRPGFVRSVSRIRGWLLLAALAASLSGMLVTALRWWMLLAIQSIHIPLWQAVRLTFLGQFYSLVVPGTVGGDIVKAYYVTQHTHAKAGAILSIFVDRIFGLAALTLVAGVALIAALLAGLGDWSDPMLRYSATVMACVVAAVLVIMAIMLSNRLRRALHLQKLYRRLPFAKTIESFGDAARVYRSRWRALGKVAAIMFGAPGIWIAALALLGRSMDMSIPWHCYFLYLPLIYILGSVPLTPGGAGWIESLYLVFFAGLANSSEILAFAILARGFPIAWAIPGMIVAISGPKLPKIKAMHEELGV